MIFVGADPRLCPFRYNLLLVNLKANTPIEISLDKSSNYKNFDRSKTEAFRSTIEDLIEMKENDRRNLKPPEKF